MELALPFTVLSVATDFSSTEFTISSTSISSAVYGNLVRLTPIPRMISTVSLTLVSVIPRLLPTFWPKLPSQTSMRLK